MMIYMKNSVFGEKQCFLTKNDKICVIFKVNRVSKQIFIVSKIKRQK